MDRTLRSQAIEIIHALDGAQPEPVDPAPVDAGEE